MFGGGCIKCMFSCKACSRSLTKESTRYDDIDTVDIASGTRFYYFGPLIDHQIFARYTNKRRVHDGHCYCMLVRILNNQQKINDIPIAMPIMRFLVIQSCGCFQNSRINPTLELSMPKLETLKMSWCCFWQSEIEQGCSHPWLKSCWCRTPPVWSHCGIATAQIILHVLLMVPPMMMNGYMKCYALLSISKALIPTNFASILSQTLSAMICNSSVFILHPLSSGIAGEHVHLCSKPQGAMAKP